MSRESDRNVGWYVSTYGIVIRVSTQGGNSTTGRGDAGEHDDFLAFCLYLEFLNDRSSCVLENRIRICCWTR